MAPRYEPGFGFAFEIRPGELPPALLRQGHVDPEAMRDLVRNGVVETVGAICDPDSTPLTTWRSQSVSGLSYEVYAGEFKTQFIAVPAALRPPLKPLVAAVRLPHLSERSLRVRYWTEIGGADPEGIFLRVEVFARKDGSDPAISIAEAALSNSLIHDFLKKLRLI